MDLCKSLSRVYTVSRFLGLIHFTFNKSKQKFERSFRQAIPNTIIVFVIKVFYGVLVYTCILKLILLYTHISSVHVESKVKPQEQFFTIVDGFLGIFFVYIYTNNYMKHRPLVVSTVNEVLKIFKRLAALTDASLYFSSVLAKLFGLKMFIVLLQTCIVLPTRILLFLPVLDVVSPYAFLITVLMPVSYMYLQMVLICFYSKMSAALETFSAQAGTRRLDKYLRQFMRLSCRIHRVKRRSDKFFSSLFLVTYLGLLFDIEKLYDVFKVVLYSKYTHKSVHLFQQSSTLLCITYTLDMYLINQLSDCLVVHEQHFQRSMFLILLRTDEADAPLTRHLDRMALQRIVYGVRTTALDRIEGSRGCAFKIILNIVICNVIASLQFYAGEEIYNKHAFHRQLW